MDININFENVIANEYGDKLAEVIDEEIRDEVRRAIKRELKRQGNDLAQAIEAYAKQRAKDLESKTLADLI